LPLHRVSHTERFVHPFSRPALSSFSHIPIYSLTPLSSFTRVLIPSHLSATNVFCDSPHNFHIKKSALPPIRPLYLLSTEMRSLKHSLIPSTVGPFIGFRPAVSKFDALLCLHALQSGGVNHAHKCCIRGSHDISGLWRYGRTGSTGGRRYGRKGGTGGQAVREERRAKAMQNKIVVLMPSYDITFRRRNSMLDSASTNAMIASIIFV
jgi:hypothetical protein